MSIMVVDPVRRLFGCSIPALLLAAVPFQIACSNTPVSRSRSTTSRITPGL